MPAMWRCFQRGPGIFARRQGGDFLVVGAYPPDQSADLSRGAPTAEMLARIARVAFPRMDPVRGADGPLTTLWRAR